MHIHQIVPVSDEAMDQLKAMDAPAQSPISTTLAGVAPIQTWMEHGQVLPDIGDVDKKILASVGNTNTILVSTTTKDILATITVSIGTNGNWEVGGVDTGIPATGTAPERVPRPVGLYNAVVLGSDNGALVLPAGLTYTVADGTDYYTLSTTAEIRVPIDESASIITIDRSGSLLVYPVSTSLWTIPPSQAVLLVRTGLPAVPVEQGWLMPTVHNAWVVAASTEGFARMAQAVAITAQQAGELAATKAEGHEARAAAAAKKAEELVDNATGGALLKERNLADLPSAEIARQNLEVPSIDDLEAVSRNFAPLLPGASAAFVYTNGLLTQMTEQLPAGERVTAYSYTDGRLTGAVETLGQLARTTTYNYQAGVLTGFTTT